MCGEKVQLTKEQETLLATLYGRALDCRGPDPILGDEAAAEAVSCLDYDFSKLKMRMNDAFSVAVRAKYLDRVAAQDLSRFSQANVLYLGCGLDTRVLRLDPPANVRWYDVDHPEVIELRERVYAKHADREGYRTIGSSVTEPRELARLVPRLDFDSAMTFIDIPELDRLPRPYRVIIGLMSRIPVLRDLGRILRYRF